MSLVAVQDNDFAQTWSKFILAALERSVERIGKYTDMRTLIRTLTVNTMRVRIRVCMSEVSVRLNFILLLPNVTSDHIFTQLINRVRTIKF